MKQLTNSVKDFKLQSGLLLRHGETVFRVHALHDGTATLEHTLSLQRKVIATADLLSRYTRGEITVEERTPVPDAEAEEWRQPVLQRLPLADLSPIQIDDTLRVMRYITGMRELGYTSFVPTALTQLDLDRLAIRYHDPEQPKAAWLYNWSRKLAKAGGDPRAAIPRYDDRGGKGQSRLNPAVNMAIKRVLEVTRQDCTKRIRTIDVVEDVKTILSVEQPDQPELAVSISSSTIKRRVEQAFSPYEICVRNDGRAVANRKFRHWYPRDRAEFPLEVFETDDTDSCIFTIDEKSGLPSGRSYITGVIDQHSEVVFGMEMSEQPRSVWSAISALVHAMLPKDKSDPALATTKSDCEIFGKPGIVVFDNALYNHSRQIEIAAHDLDISVAWAKPKTPTEKSCIEGWHAILKRECLPNLPGFRGDRKLRDGLKAGEASATMGFRELRQATFQWTYDVYANDPKSRDGMTPMQRWHGGLRMANPRIPRDVFGLRLLPTLDKELSLRPEGLLMLGIVYSHPILQLLRKKHGHNAACRIRFNPADLGKIYVLDPEGRRYFEVPSTCPEYAEGLTAYQHKLIRRIARENGAKNPYVAQFLLYREALRKLTYQLRFSKKLFERKLSVRAGDVPGKPGKTVEAPSVAKVIIQTELERRLIELESIELDEEAEAW